MKRYKAPFVGVNRFLENKENFFSIENIIQAECIGHLVHKNTNGCYGITCNSCVFSSDNFNRIVNDDANITVMNRE